MIRALPAILALALLAAPPAMAAPSTNPAEMAAGTWALDKSHASLTASVRHMGLSDYTLRFNSIDASFNYDPKAPESTRVEAVIAAASLDTGVEATNAKFAEEFLAAGANPTIRFVSTAITRTDANHGTMTGDLTLRGVTRPVTLDVTFNGSGAIMGRERAGFSARTVIKRSDFGSDFLLRPPLALVGDEVEIVLELEFARK